MTTYFDELTRTMLALSQNQDVVFLGQSVKFAGTAMRNTLLEVEDHKLIELPVEEDFQMGLATGMAMNGYVPISIYPRWNFLLLATNQIVNHLDKLAELTKLNAPPKVIIRTGIGSVDPLHPGPQHVGDYTDAFRLLAPNINVVRLENKSQIFPAYMDAYTRTDGVSTILVEWSDYYNSRNSV